MALISTVFLLIIPYNLEVHNTVMKKYTTIYGTTITFFFSVYSMKTSPFRPRTTSSKAPGLTPVVLRSGLQVEN